MLMPLIPFTILGSGKVKYYYVHTRLSELTNRVCAQYMETDIIVPTVSSGNRVPCLQRAVVSDGSMVLSPPHSIAASHACAHTAGVKTEQVTRSIWPKTALSRVQTAGLLYGITTAEAHSRNRPRPRFKS